MRLPDERQFDFLIFDRNTALIHNYGTAEIGRQIGGWLTHEPDVISRLEQTAEDLRRQAVPLQQYLATI